MNSTNEYGPAGTYGCACKHRDARDCLLDQYIHYCGDGECECLCHKWPDDDDDDDDDDIRPRAPAKGNSEMNKQTVAPIDFIELILLAAAAAAMAAAIMGIVVKIIAHAWN